MRLLSIEPTLKTPGVILSDGALLFQGTSIIESADSFFEPIFSWINEYLENPSPLTAITIRLQYIDTASVKNISKMLVALVELKKKGLSFTVNWYYLYGDLEILQLGTILQERLKIEFEFHEFEPDNSIF